MYVKPARVDLLRVGAHYSISSIFEEYPDDIKLFCYSARSEDYTVKEAGKLKLVTGKVKIISNVTRDERMISFGVLHLGDHNINAGVRYFIDSKAFSEMQEEISEVFENADIPLVIRLIDKHFGPDTYSLWHLFRDEQRKVVNQLLQLTYEGIDTTYRQIYENNYAIMNFIQTLHIPVAKAFLVAAEHIVNTDLKIIFHKEDIDIERLETLINETKKWSLVIDRAGIGYAASEKVNSLMEALNGDPENVSLIRKVVSILKLFGSLMIDLDLWKAQNVYFSIGKILYGEMRAKADAGDSRCAEWVETFGELGRDLHVKVT
jgi:hypothetical protein